MEWDPSRLAQGHLHTQLGGGAGDPTSNLPATSQPTLPPTVALWLTTNKRLTENLSLWTALPSTTAPPLEMDLLVDWVVKQAVKKAVEFFAAFIHRRMMGFIHGVFPQLSCISHAFELWVVCSKYNCLMRFVLVFQVSGSRMKVRNLTTA